MSTAVRPNLFVIGAPKAGTTSLCELLDNHPDLFMSNPKEPDFFSLGEARGRSERWYAELFADGAGHRILAEGSTNYSVTGVYPGIAAKLFSYSPEARIIYAVRNPYDRMSSEWMQWRDMGILDKPFDAAVREVPAMLEGCMYWKNLSAYRQHFTDDRILVLFFEDLSKDTEAVVRRCFEFLGLSTDVRLEDPSRPRNVSKGKREDRRLLAKLREVPGYNKHRDRLIPVPVRRALKGFVTRPLSRPRWDGPTLAFVREHLKEDTERFLSHHAKPSDYWPCPRPE